MVGVVPMVWDGPMVHVGWSVWGGLCDSCVGVVTLVYVGWYVWGGNHGAKGWYGVGWLPVVYGVVWGG